MNAKTIVLGAGPAGLAFSYEYGGHSLILEKENRLGGLSKSVKILDGVFDLGGHSFHTPHPEIASLVQTIMGNNWHQQKRDAQVWIEGTLIPYPFQHHYQKLNNQQINDDCKISSLSNTTKSAQSTNFEEWIINKFGAGISKHFMLPYNRKLWAHPLTDICIDWVDQRIATSTEAKNQTKKQREPLQSNSKVGYPLRGGFGQIFEELAKHCEHIHFGQKVNQIDIRNQTLTTTTGDRWEWESIISTIPVTQLLKSINNCPLSILELTNNLKQVSLKILLVLARLQTTTVPQRIYIADPKIPPHKVAFNHTSSPLLLARENHAIMCEISYSASKPPASDEALTEQSICWLIDAGIINSLTDILHTQIVDLPHGYPINTHKKTDSIQTIKAFLRTHNIYSIGRFGAWDYANSDECMRQGLELARKLKQ